MNNKFKLIIILLIPFFVLFVMGISQISFFIQKTMLLLIYKDSILCTNSNKLFIDIEFVSVFYFTAILIKILYDIFFSKNIRKSNRKNSVYQSSMKLLKISALVTLFIVLIYGRCFTIVTKNKIYYSSWDTLFLTKAYDYSEVKEIDIESHRQRAGYELQYNISFENHNVNLMNCLDIDRDIKINKVHRNIIKNSEGVKKKQNLVYRTEDVLKMVNTLTDLS